ncbi:hypothetical protein HYT60_00505 [Candidatus Woesebacteria bacterium]|nr:hypothetical protein [Candidatus Woesebacteria bacterium]
MKKLKNFEKKAQILWLFLFTLVAAITVDFFHLNFLIATLILFGIPSLYLTFNNPRLIKKSLLFMVIIVIPMVLIFEYLAFVDQTWFVPNSAFRFLDGSIPIEVVVWSILWVYYGVMFWEYFLDTEKRKRLFPKSIMNLILFVTLLLLIFFFLYIFYPGQLYIPYFYLALGITFGIIPMSYLLWKYPRLLPKLLIIGVYFFGVSLLTELVGLRQYHWYFGGAHYLGYLNVSGQKLPYDEILFWWGIGLPAMVCWYEFFADDRQ